MTFLKPSSVPREQGGVHYDPDEAQQTIVKLQEADAHDKILIVAAHDESLLSVLDFFPKYANDFSTKNWVKQGRWAFLKDYEQALG